MVPSLEPEGSTLSRGSHLWYAWTTLSTLKSTFLSRLSLQGLIICARPELLVMDEPAADLDLPARETLLATLDGLAHRWSDLTMITVTHHLEDLLPDTTNVLLLSHGEVVASGPPETVLNSDNLSRAFECPITVECDDGRWRWSVSRHAWDRLLRELS